MDGYAIPEYPYIESGVLLVVGSAPCLYDDVNHCIEVLNKLGRKFSLMAINEAAGALRVDHIATMHVDKMRHFKKLQLQLREKLKVSGDLLTHACDKIEPGMKFEHYPAVDFFWNGANSAATSAFAGVKIGLIMGFDEILMCGCPMNGGDGYFNDDVTDKGSTSNPRFGYISPDKGLVKSWQETVGVYAEAFGDQVYSMSGYTGKILGVPSWLQH